MMAEMTGMEFYRELARRTDGLASRVIFMTGGAFTDEAREFLRSTANETITKPFDLNKLRATVDAVLERFGERQSV